MIRTRLIYLWKKVRRSYQNQGYSISDLTSLSKLKKFSFSQRQCVLMLFSMAISQLWMERSVFQCTTVLRSCSAINVDALFKTTITGIVLTPSERSNSVIRAARRFSLDKENTVFMTDQASAFAT